MNNSLDKLTIRGFKSIRELKDFELKNLNLFVGANGAGKSNLISFFRMLQSLMGGSLADFVRDSGGISDLLHNGRKATKYMEFEARFGCRGYRFKLKPDPGEGFALTDEARYHTYNGVRGSWWEFGDSSDNSSLLVEETKGKSRDRQYSKPVYDAICSWRIYHFHDTSPTAAMRHAEIIEDNKALRYDASNIGPFLLCLRNEERSCYDEILNACRLVAPFLNDFLLTPQQLGPKTKVSLSWKAKGSDYPMQPYHLSDGSIRFICLATALLQSEPPSTIIIDEPELGLHPEAVRVLAELIKDAAKRTQIVVATQSPLLLDQFAIEDIVVVNRKEGQSTFERLKRSDFTEWLEDYSVGELWTKNVIQGGTTHE